MTRIILVVRAYFGLMAFDLFTWRHDFASLHRRVKDFPLGRIAANPSSMEAVTSALNIACCFYPKQALCLQRSAVLVKMFRANGVRAQMVIGVQQLPFKAHAWVEASGEIINDRLASRETFLILEVC